jgi:hypothetical protein
MRRDFCTYLDRRYLDRGLALYRSLERHAGDFRLFVLAFDQESRAALAALGLARAAVHAIDELERFDPELAAVRSVRSAVDGYFTATPALLAWLLETHPEIDQLTYLDADLLFFASPEPLFGELAGGSVGIVPHRFPERLRGREVYGRYNVGWVSFRRDAPARACLADWRRSCLDWCFDRVEPGRFADQKYLDAWPERYPGVVVLQHPGADLAPWNLDAHALAAGADGGLLVDGRPLVFFHAHGVERMPDGRLEPHLEEYGVAPGGPATERIYAEVGRALAAADAELAAAGFRSAGGPPLRAAPGASRTPAPARRGEGSERRWPTISLVTPCRNCAPTLEATLRSVLDQGYPALEYVVVDGGSTDGSVAILERYADRLSSWSSAPDRGQAHALNQGFARTTGEVLGWLNADDLLLPGSLSLVGELFADFPEIEWLTGRATSLDPAGRIVDSVPSLPWTRTLLLAATEEFVQQESTFFRRGLWERAGGCLSEEHLACDYELWARFFRHAPLHRTRAAIGAFRLRPGQASRARRERYAAEVAALAARERALRPPARDEADEALHELAFDLGDWRFARVEVGRARGGTGRDLALDLARAEAALAAAERDRAARLEAIRALEAAVAGQREAIAAFESALAGRRAESAALESALAEQREAIAAFEAALSGRGAEIAALESAHAEQREALAAFEAALAGRGAESAALAREVEALRASASWRWTAPVRRLASLLRRE